MDSTLRDVSDSTKLEGQSNYLLWSYRVKMTLMQESLWRFITPATQASSSSNSDSGTTSNLTSGAAAAPTTNDEEERKIRVCRIIVATVKDHIILHILHLTDPLEIWEKLKSMYDVESPSRRLALKEKFHSLRMSETKTIDSHLQDTNSLVTQLASLGVTISDEDLVDQVLASLPRSWATFKAIHKNRQPHLCFSDLQGLMLHEESSRLTDQQHETEEVLYLRNAEQYRNPNFRNSRGGSSRGSRGGRSGGYNRGRGRGTSNIRTCSTCKQQHHPNVSCEVHRLEKQIRDLQLQLSQLKSTTANTYSTTDLIDEDDEGTDQEAALNACISAFSIEEEPWFLDSGASSHVTGNPNLLSETSTSHIASIRTAAGQVLPVKHKGHVNFSDPKVKQVNNILYVPGVTTNLLSVGRFADLGHTILFNSNHCYILDDKIDLKMLLSKHRPFLQASRDPRTKLYKLVTKPAVTNSYTLATTEQSKPSLQTIDLWHRRLAHVNQQSLYHLSNRNLVNGIHRIPYVIRPCTNCLLGKSHRQAFPKLRSTFSTQPLELIHSDLCGPMPTATRTNCTYIITFIDDYSRKTWIYFLSTKSQTLTYFAQFKQLVETPERKIQKLRSDRGGEYLSNDFQSFCHKHGIHHQLTSGYSPQQNGVAKRKNRTLLEGIRSVASGTRLPRYLWDEVAKTVNYIQNRLPCRALNLLTPEEAFTGQKPNISHLKVVGCLAFCHVPKEKRNKLDQKSIPSTLFLGYDEHSKAYRCWNPLSKKVVISRDVNFIENQFSLPSIPTISTSELLDPLQPPTTHSNTLESHSPISGTNTQNLPDYLPDQFPDIPNSPSSPIHQSPLINSSSPIDTEPCSNNPTGASCSNTSTVQVQPLNVRRGSRSRAPNIKLGDYYVYLTTNLPDCDVNTTLALTQVTQDPLRLKFQDAIIDPAWHKAMQEEMRSIQHNNTWRLEDLPTGVQPITCKWVYRTKPGTKTSPPIHKARLVARGFQQQHGLDYDETFAPVIKWVTIRTVVALAASKRWQIHHMDVRTAFLHGILREEVYMTQPPGFEVPGQEAKVCRLLRSLYGLKQSPRLGMSE